MYLITGTSGHFGKKAAELFIEKNPDQKLAILSRSADSVKELTDLAAEARVGDYGDYSSLLKAFDGIDQLLFVSSNDFVNRETHHKNVIKAAAAAGVKRLVFTSFQFRSTAADSPNGLMPVYVATENFLKESGLTYTILRNGIYMDMLPDIIGPAIREQKTLFAPAGNTNVAFTFRDDLAEAAAKILLSPGFENKTIDLTNTEAVNFPEIAALLAEVLKTEVQYVDPSNEEYQQALSSVGLPAEVVGLFAGILASMKAGEFDKTTTDLATILGRKPRSVAEFLNDYYA